MDSTQPTPNGNGDGLKETLSSLITLSGLTEEDYRILQEHAPKTQAWMDEIFDDFYKAIFAHPASANFFPDGEHKSHERYLHKWYMQAASGDYSANYWQNQWVVGLVHIRKHVSNPFMFGAMSRLQQMFLKKCLEQMPPTEAERLYGAFKRVTDVVAGLIAEAYFMNYVDALADVAGFRKNLVEQMMNLEINKRLAQARADAKAATPKD